MYPAALRNSNLTNMLVENDAESIAMYEADASHEMDASSLDWNDPNIFSEVINPFWENGDLAASMEPLEGSSMYHAEDPSASSMNDSPINGDTVNSWYPSTDGNLQTASSANRAWGSLSPASDEVHDQFPEMKSQGLQSQPNSMTEAMKPLQKKYFCEFVGCGACSFRDSASFKRHMRSHDPNANRWVCGNCGKETVRKDNLFDHLRKKHELPKEALPLSCKTCSYRQDGLSGGRKEILFSTQSSLAKHLAEKHTEVQVSQGGTSPSGFDSSALDTVKNSSAGITSIPGATDHSNTVRSSNTTPSKTSKHPLRLEQRLSAKRRKFEQSKTDLTQTPGSRPVGATYQDNIQKPFASTVAYPNYEIIHGVRTMDMLLLFKIHDFLLACEYLDLSLVIFNASKGIIELHGPAKVAKDSLEEGLKASRRFMPTGSRSSNQTPSGRAMKTSARLKSNISTCSRSTPTPNTIYAVRAKEDSGVASFWTKYILPILSKLLRPLLGDNYSAALVRQGSSLESSTPVIRISSVFGQSGPIRKQILDKIYSICREHGRSNIPMIFSIGTMEQIARSHGEFEGEEDEENKVLDFPHQKRDWRQPGMGASIGYQEISATLGGYILIDQQIYMLTVDHLFDKGSPEGNTTITSPSLTDVSELIGDIGQTFRDIEAAASDLLNGLDLLSEGISLDVLRDSLEFNAFVDQLDDWKHYYRELQRDEKDFDLGCVYRRSGRRLKPAPGEPSSSDQNQLQCRMNWSVVEVLKNRLGENRHRHTFSTETGIVDFSSENQYPKGAGPLCQVTCDVGGSDQVHFVGESSGRRTGQINATRRLICCEGVESYEFTIVPNEPRDPKNYRGDSGAWVIRSSDNALVGLLWCWYDGHLVFTSINEVFADIRDTLNATEICLPKSMRPNSGVSGHDLAVSHGISIARKQEKGPRMPRNLLILRRQALSNKAQSISTNLVRAEQKESPAALQHVPSHMPDPVSQPLKSGVNPKQMDVTRLTELPTVANELEPVVQALTNNGTDIEVKDTAETTTPATGCVSTRPPTPVPSLSYSVSSSPKTSTLSPSTPRLQPQLGYIPDGSVIAITEEDGGAEVNSEESHEPRPFSFPRCLPERTLGKGQNESKLALGYILETMNLTDDQPASPYKMLMRDEPWQSINTWRTNIGVELG